MATWTVSDDGQVYTFSIMPEVPWVKYNAETDAVEQVVDESGNVRYVTAEDFAYGIRRSIGGQLGSYYGGIMASWSLTATPCMPANCPSKSWGSKSWTPTPSRSRLPSRPLSCPPSSACGRLIASRLVIEEYGDFWYEPESFQANGRSR
jgi:hypothetical protein